MRSEEERDLDTNPPEPYNSWEEWERTKDSENDQDMRKYIRSMV